MSKEKLGELIALQKENNKVLRDLTSMFYAVNREVLSQSIKDMDNEGVLRDGKGE